MLNRTAAFVYGLICYAIFLVTFLYAIGFVGNVFVPKSIDTGPTVSLTEALLVDTLLLSLFAIQHSVMARQWFKRAWTKIIPKEIERSTYVLLASLVLILLFWQWRPMTQIVWDVQSPIPHLVLQALFWIGWAGVLFSTYLVDHFGLFGMKQVYRHLKEQPDEPPAFTTPALYKFVRHPLYLGFVVAFWSTPRMTLGHLFFAAVCTAYILVAIQFEERDLIHSYGDRYRKYRTQVSMILPVRFGKVDKT
jgi:protein-S-isoprenylcysteine O-methyltransferase Ste14